MAAYAEGTKGKLPKTEDDDEYPAKEFEELLQLLEQSISEAKAYCKNLGADIDRILTLGEKGFKEIELFQEYANTIASLYYSAKPEVYEYPVLKKGRDVFQYLRDVVIPSLLFIFCKGL